MKRICKPSPQIQVTCHTTANNDMPYIDSLFLQDGMALHKFFRELSCCAILESASKSASMRFGERCFGPEYMPLYRGMEPAERECQLSGHGDRKWAHVWNSRIIDLLATKLFQCSRRPSRALGHLQHAGNLVICATDTFVDSISEDTERRMRCCDYE